MTTSSLDTLDIARRLKSVGFIVAQPKAAYEIIRDVRTADLANLATRADIERLEAKLEIFRRDMTIRLGSMIVVATGILLAAKFFG